MCKDSVPYSGHDTVCIVGKDQTGYPSAATSTSGLFMKENGRVGDSPISGSGFYANNSAGACAATELGEDIMKACISYEVVRLMSEGMIAQQVVDIAINHAKEQLIKRYKNVVIYQLFALIVTEIMGVPPRKQKFHMYSVMKI